MFDYRSDFSIDDGVWLNVASEGPLPYLSREALLQSIHWKMSPARLTIPKFQQIPIQLKSSLAQFIGADAKDIILGNSATYGIHLLANGIEFKAGDEIIVMRNDFPTDILPWLHLAKRGIIVHQLKGQGLILTVDEVVQAITPKTKVVCLPLVHSFSGWPMDIAAIGKICRERGIIFIVNVSQALGAQLVSVKDLSADAIVCAGYKWLLGPYGTGFCWMTQALREQLVYPQAYWISLMDERSLTSEDVLALPQDTSSRRFDIFATANFFNYVPWHASLEYLLNIGLNTIDQHNQSLCVKATEGLKNLGFVLISPMGQAASSKIVVFSHTDKTRNASIHEHLKNHGFHLALWKGHIRLSAHIYNTASDIDAFIGCLRKL